jgi:hypothetical protein
VTSRMFAAVAAALVAGVLSLAGASLVVAGQPQAGGGNDHANNGNAWAKGHAGGGGGQGSQPAPAPTTADQSGLKQKSKSGGHGGGQQSKHITSAQPAHGGGHTSHVVKKQPAPAAAPAPSSAPTRTQAPKSGGSHSTAMSGPGNSGQGCDGSHNSNTGHGANHSGPYDNTCDGSPSGNGNGNGKATGKPCAGCVGNADDKNPKGQYPNGSDHNAGSECDRNHGIGRSNPAHTGCRSTETPTPPGGGGGCPKTSSLSTALTHAAAVALKAMATVHPELAKLSDEAAATANEKCGNDEGELPGGHQGGGHGKGKITICHATGSATNPYVEITISVNGLNGHAHHQDGRDIIPAPVGGCPAASTTPPQHPGGPTKQHSGGPPTTETTTHPSTTALAGEQPATPAPGQQMVLGEQQSGSSTPAGTSAPATPGASAVLGATAQGTTPAGAVAPASANRALPAETSGGSLPFTGTDAILVLFLGCVLVLGGVALYRVTLRRAS